MQSSTLQQGRAGGRPRRPADQWNSSPPASLDWSSRIRSSALPSSLARNPPLRVRKAVSMTESEPAPAEAEGRIAWTCARCEMTLSFAQEVERPRLPTTWAQEEGLLYCLSCRREMAGEAGLAGI